MNEPDDYGLSPVQTLCHVFQEHRAAGHGAFWSTWYEEVFAHRPVLELRKEPDPSDLSATHEIQSIGHVRFGCRLIEPEQGATIVGAVVVVHGANPDTLEDECLEYGELARKGVAVLVIRVRGFAGSKLDVGKALSCAEQWICHGLETPIHPRTHRCNWIISGAVADIVCAYRAMQRWLEESRSSSTAVALSGTSLGGGLCMLAASQLADSYTLDRLAIELPSLGDWWWRLDQPVCDGLGRCVKETIGMHPTGEEQSREVLSVFDTAAHARRVSCPVLCRLAILDDVVPAPSAAAVYNALDTSPGLKWRFVTPYGHFDGGLAAARRVALWKKARLNFLDLNQSPQEAMQRWEPELGRI